MNYLTALEEAYQGEVFGLAFYSGLAQTFSLPDHAAKWQAMARLEVLTGAVLRPVLARHGISTEPSDVEIKRGLAEIERHAKMTWPQLMQLFSDELDVDIAEYSKLRSLGNAQDDEALRMLLDHELVAKEFCELELAGHGDRAIAPVLNLIAEIEQAIGCGGAEGWPTVANTVNT
jgi:hypothetical protein